MVRGTNSAPWVIGANWSRFALGSTWQLVRQGFNSFHLRQGLFDCLRRGAKYILPDQGQRGIWIFSHSIRCMWTA